MTDQIDQDVELDEEIEEAHDPANAEAQSIASVDAAEDKGPKAKKRKGDKDAGDKAPIPAATKAAAPQAESIDFNGDFSEDLNALVESEATLSEEFKAKTAVIFEAAVKSKLSEEITRLESEDASIKGDLVEKVDSYLIYVVENWMEENKLAIQSGLRTEIAEGFMSKLKDVFTESYVEVPESKVDLVDELSTANEELEEDFNKAVAKSIELQEELEGYQREAVIREAAKDLAETQVEKLKSLVESIDFEDVDVFASKVSTIKESYFKKQTAESVISEESTDEEGSAVEVSGVMESYLAAIRKAKH